MRKRFRAVKCRIRFREMQAQVFFELDKAG